MIDLLDKDDITESDIKKLIELKVEESIHLDFKRAESLGKTDGKRNEMAKDVAAFANSAGGIIIYGISEKNHVADSLSFIDGDEFTKEWLEQIMQTRIQRKIEGLKIFPVRFDGDIKQSIYVVKIPESRLAPHMTSDKRFYRRYNFESVQMEEYEVRSLYNRPENTELEINDILPELRNDFDTDEEGRKFVFQTIAFQIENRGKVIEKNFKLTVIPQIEGVSYSYNRLNPSPPVVCNIDGSTAFSFSNSSPIFPGELMVIGQITIRLPLDRLEEIRERGELELRLMYSNGSERLSTGVRGFLKSIKNVSLLAFPLVLMFI